MKILVTGGAGFIGSHIVDTLIDKGAKVIILDNLKTGLIQNINEKADFVKGDILNQKLISNILTDCDTIYHLAAFTSVPESFIKKDECISINQVALNNILSISSKKNIKKIILSSSSAVYPDDKIGPFDEISLTNPTSPYGITKLYGEKILKMWSKEKEVRSGISLRYFNVYGPRQEANSDYASVIPKFLNKIKQDEPIVIYGDGNQTRDYIFIDDIVNVNLLALDIQSYNCFAVGTGIEISINQLIELIKKISNKKITILFDSLPKGDALRSCAKIDKIKNHGINSFVKINDGLKMTWQSIINE
ncbi:NAD-dependent epimerase/dehydratase family protein [Candidatus Marinimicrobia bacterium]|nr:NAD-dependent epimerase/dehydratase family protein [Candidatus Neomarinimicrobiota bacterium]